MDYTVFVHVMNANGSAAAQHDGMPQLGAYPTRLWVAGEDVADTHPLQLPSGSYRAAGLPLVDTLVWEFPQRRTQGQRQRTQLRHANASWLLPRTCARKTQGTAKSNSTESLPSASCRRVPVSAAYKPTAAR